MPLISIIVPNFNHADFLDDRLDSIMHQTFQDFEVIILDDGSTDSSSQIIAKYEKNERVSKIIKNTENSGSVFLQWKKGLEAACGDWIWIAESDDASEFDFLEEAVSRISSETSFVYCKSIIIDAQGNRIGDATEWLSDLSRDKWQNDFTSIGAEDFYSFHIYKNVVLNTSAVIFKKENANRVIYYPDGFKICGDWLFFAQLSLLGHVSYISKPLNYWRQHETSTRNVFSLEYEYRRLIENINIIKHFLFIAKRDGKKVNILRFKWIVNRWLSMFTYKDLFTQRYLCIPLPFQLKMFFYRGLVTRVFSILYNKIFSKKPQI